MDLVTNLPTHFIPYGVYESNKIIFHTPSSNARCLPPFIISIRNVNQKKKYCLSFNNFFMQKYVYLGGGESIGATLRTRRESQCLPQDLLVPVWI